MKIPRAVVSLLLVGPSFLGGIAAAQGQPAAAAAPTQPAPGVPDLLLYPSRVVFEGNKRSMQLGLVNNLNATATYRIRFVNRRMTPTGQLEEVSQPGPGERFATDLLKYAPRQVVLPPGGTQAVRIMVRKPGDLPEGEYRSHLMFERLPDAAAPEAPKRDTGTGIAIELKPLVSVTIPVIVRHGRTGAQAGLTGLSITQPRTKGPPVLGFRITRRGNASLFGDLEVALVDGGRSQTVAKANGVAVYVPNQARNVLMELTLPPGARPPGGELQVIYRARPEDGGAVLARAALPLR